MSQLVRLMIYAGWSASCFLELTPFEKTIYQQDYVDVYNGGPDGVHIGRYCGDQTPSNLSSANSLWIKFNSDNSGTAAGFIAAYTLMHGATLSGKNA